MLIITSSNTALTIPTPNHLPLFVTLEYHTLATKKKLVIKQLCGSNVNIMYTLQKSSASQIRPSNDRVIW